MAPKKKPISDKKEKKEKVAKKEKSPKAAKPTASSPNTGPNISPDFEAGVIFNK